jgi:hypothetical protein
LRASPDLANGNDIAAASVVYPNKLVASERLLSPNAFPPRSAQDDLKRAIVAGFAVAGP